MDPATSRRIGRSLACRKPDVGIQAFIRSNRNLPPSTPQLANIVSLSHCCFCNAFCFLAFSHFPSDFCASNCRFEAECTWPLRDFFCCLRAARSVFANASEWSVKLTSPLLPPAVYSRTVERKLLHYQRLSVSDLPRPRSN